MRPIFCGNLDYDTRQSEVERLFRRYGRIDKIDMKSGFAFVYMEDDRDADDAIRALDRSEFGRKGRRLRIEWAKHEERGGGGGGSRVGRGSRRSPGSMRPSKTLFVINFDPVSTRMRDLERHFEAYGKIVNIRIRRNFAFVQYDSLEDASKAFEGTNGSKLLDRVLSVEYALRDDDESPSRRGGERNGDGGRDRSPNRDRYRARERSPSPYGRGGRERGSPDYGRGQPSPRDNNGRAKSPQSRSPVNGGHSPPIPERERSRERSRERVRDRSRDRSRERGRYREEKSEEKKDHLDKDKERDRDRKRERSEDRDGSEERATREKDREMSDERDTERARDRFRSVSPEDRA